MTCRKGRKDCRSSGGGQVKTDEFGGGIRLEFTLNSMRIQAEFSKFVQNKYNSYKILKKRNYGVYIWPN